MSDALFDNYMLQNFPGKTLEEIDEMDSLRWFRAMAARNIAQVEETRKLQMAGIKKGKEIPDYIYRSILEHDKICRDFEEALINGKQYNSTDYSG